MNKKQRILPIADKIEINTEAFTNENLPDSEAVNQTVALVTGKSVQVSAEIPPQYQQSFVAPKQIGRPKKEIADGRVKYNTMIKPEWIRALRIRAAEQDISPADLLERIFQDSSLLK